MIGDGSRSQRIENVVLAGNAQFGFAQGNALFEDREVFASLRLVADVGGRVHIFRTQAEGYDFRVGDAFHRLFNIGIVSVDHKNPVGLQSELMERTDDIIQRSEIIEMVGVDVENHREIGMKLQKGIHILAGFTDDGV